MAPAVFRKILPSGAAAACALALLPLLLPPLPAAALGIVSRSCAPLGAQESITVDWHFEPHFLHTVSFHYLNGIFLHAAQSGNEANGGWDVGWRAYAGHFGSEFWYGRVIGQHYLYSGGVIAFLGTSQASNCNLRQWG